MAKAWQHEDLKQLARDQSTPHPLCKACRVCTRKVSIADARSDYQCRV